MTTPPTSAEPIRTTAQIKDETLGIREELARALPKRERAKEMREIERLRRGAMRG